MAEILKYVVISNAIRYIDASDETTSLTEPRPSGSGCPFPNGRGSDSSCETASRYPLPDGRGSDSSAYDSGYQDGMIHGIEQESIRLQAQFETLTTLLQGIPDAISKNRLDLQTEISDIVLLLAEQLFINQQQNKDLLTHQIAQILNQLNDKQTIEIALHPQDLALIKQGKINLDVGSCKNLRLIPDDELRLGGCVIRSQHGVFNASIERQIDNLKQVLLDIRTEATHV